MKFITAFLTVVFCASSGLAQETIPAGGIKLDDTGAYTQIEIESRAREAVQKLVDQFESTPTENLIDYDRREELCDELECGDVSESEASWRLTKFFAGQIIIREEANSNSDNWYKMANFRINLGSFILAVFASIAGFMVGKHSAKNNAIKTNLGISPHEDTKGDTK